jgi:3'-phosphoadenosine 5'-phosphosulfate (PAPS) 3'-phosphatase
MKPPGISFEEDWKVAISAVQHNSPVFINSKLYPFEDEPNIRTVLWKTASGLCTAFCIAVNEQSDASAKYVNYLEITANDREVNRYRAAYKVDPNTQSVLIDSSKYKAVSINDGDKDAKDGQGRRLKNQGDKIAWKEVWASFVLVT